jgi:hypothetical protein
MLTITIGNTMRPSAPALGGSSFTMTSPIVIVFIAICVYAVMSNRSNQIYNSLSQ